MESLRLPNYKIHFEIINASVVFKVLPIVEYVDTNDYAYISNDDELLSEYNESNCIIKFHGYYQDRGIVDSKIYFPEEEYQGPDLKVMYDIYTQYIIPWCQAYFKKQSPN